MAKDKPNVFAAISNKRKEEQEKIVDKALNNEKKAVKEAPKKEEISKKEDVKEEKAEPAVEKSEEKKAVKVKKNKADEKPENTNSFQRTTISIPSEYIEYVNIASALYFKGKASGYISSLIEKDIKENGKKYKQIMELSK